MSPVDGLNVGSSAWVNTNLQSVNADSLGSVALFNARRSSSNEPANDIEPLLAEVSPDDLHAEDVFPAPEPGYVRMGPDILTPEALDSIVDLAKQIKLDESLNGRRLNKMVSDIQDKGAVSREDLKDFDKFVTAMRSWHHELHVAYRDSDYSDQKISDKISKTHQFLHQWDGAKERYNIQAKSEELQRIAEGSPSVNPTTTGFYTYAGLPQRDMKEALDVMDGLQKGDSGISFAGNSTRMLTRGEIWQQKIQLLDQAVTDARAGHPQEIDVQYYELTSRTLLKRLAEAARAGCPVRVNMDPGRIKQDRDQYMYASELAQRLNTAYRLLDVAGEGRNVAFTMFPVEREIGSENLMHQKLFRVGEKVILGGMNANSKSGDNVDAAVLVQGPGARRLVGVFERDTKLSLGATLKDVYDPEQTALISGGGMYIGPSGFLSLLLNAAGPKHRSVDGPVAELTVDTLEKLAEAADTRLDLLLGFDDVNGDGVLDGQDLENFLRKGDIPSNTLPLKREGGRLLARQLKEVMASVSKPDNQEKAAEITLPDGPAQGRETLAVGDEPTERMAILLYAISNAEQFIYIPTFVMTRPVARALIARQQELKAQGRELDVKVILDPGIYPDGGTPNEPAFLALEDAGIPVRWSMLTRTDPAHARKVHAKEIVTDKMALLGSTNMSSKGLKNNWELSGVVSFDLKDAGSVAQREHLTQDFKKTWDEESIMIDTRVVADDRLKDVDTPDRPSRLEECRHEVVFEVIHMLNTYGRESAAVVTSLLEQHPELQEDIRQRIATGVPPGYAILSAFEEKLPKGTLRAALEQIGVRKKLDQLSTGHYITE